jgi:hypothetical protein
LAQYLIIDKLYNTIMSNEKTTAEDLLMSMVEPQEEQVEEQPIDTTTEEETSGNTSEGSEADEVEETETPTEEIVSENTEEEVAEKPSEIEEEDDEDWDTEAPITEDTIKPDFDFNSLSNDLGVEFSTKEELVSAVKELQNGLKEAQTNSTQLDDYMKDIPDDLKEAIDVSKKGGDYLDYLDVSSINYDSINNRDLLYDSVRSYFAEGDEGEAAVEEYIDDLGETEVNIKGSQIRNQLKYSQQESKQAITNKIQAQKQQAEKQLKTAISEVNAVDGYKLNSNHKKKIFDDIASGKMMKEMFGGPDGKYDYSKMVKNYFKVAYWDKVQAYNKKRIQTSTKREIIDELTNASVETPSSIPSRSAKAKSAMDTYMDKLQGK